jgi:hypothetical protein
MEHPASGVLHTSAHLWRPRFAPKFRATYLGPLVEAEVCSQVGSCPLGLSARLKRRADSPEEL